MNETWALMNVFMITVSLMMAVFAGSVVLRKRKAEGKRMRMICFIVIVAISGIGTALFFLLEDLSLKPVAVDAYSPFIAIAISVEAAATAAIYAGGGKDGKAKIGNKL